MDIFLYSFKNSLWLSTYYNQRLSFSFYVYDKKLFIYWKQINHFKNISSILLQYFLIYSI